MNTSRQSATKKSENKIDEVAPLSDEQLKQMETSGPEHTPDDLDNLLNNLDQKSIEGATELTAEYLDFSTWKIEETRRYAYTGPTTITDGNGEVIQAATLVDKDRTTFVCASKVVVQSLMKIESVPAAVAIQYNGKKDGNKGRYHDVRVYQL